MMKKIIAMGLILVMLCAMVCLPVSAAGDAMKTEDIRDLLNSVTLHPQKTGYLELDEVLEEILAPYRGEDVYTQIKAAYDYTVYHINFSWAPYSQNWAPAYDCFAVQHELTYDEGLQEAIPWDTANRAYHALTAHEGVCYDYASVFAVMARYIGINSYVHTGPFVFEAGFGSGSGHHGWAELEIDGANYIFDPQRDYRLSYNATIQIDYYYFGISYENAWRYTQETEINAARDAQFLSVTAERERKVPVNAYTSASCTVEGQGCYAIGSEATLIATSDAPFAGWYAANGALLSAEETYTFPVEAATDVYALCEGEYFVDLKGDEWYFDAANNACEAELIRGMGEFSFAGDEILSRAMALTILARFGGDDGSAATSSFTDVESGSWYESAVNWGVEKGVVNGRDEVTFAPDDPVTREEFITMLIRYAGLEHTEAELAYPDAADISDYARTAMQTAHALGLIEGYEDGTLRPQGELTRAEGVTILLRLAACLAE